MHSDLITGVHMQSVSTAFLPHDLRMFADKPPLALMLSGRCHA